MSAVELDRQGAVAILRLNQPSRLNAINPEVTGDIVSHMTALNSDSSVRSVVITGTGKAFCAGGDPSSMGVRTAPDVHKRLQRAHVWVQKIVECDKPVIAAVNGASVGAGFSLAMLCDLVLVSDQAYFLAGFPNIGAAPDLGLAYMLPRLIGMQRSKELLMTNRRVEPDEAVGMGLALRKTTAASLLDEALALAKALADGPAVSLGLTKSLVNEAFDTPFDAFLGKEAMAQAIAFGSAEFAEGVSAFLEKRKPKFSDS